MKNKTIGWLLFAFVFVYGIYTGGGLFEAAVIVPVWSASAEAARHWGTNPLEAVEGARFFLVAGPLATLLALLLFILGWKAPGPLRFWVLLAAGLCLVQFGVTMVYFVPEQLAIKGPRMIQGLSDAEIMSRAGRWVALNYVRGVYALVTLWAGLKAYKHSSVLEKE